MKAKYSIPFALSLAVMLIAVLGGCGPGPEPVRAQPPAVAPERVVESFYSWYIAYPGNPLAAGAYRTSEYVTEALVQKVDGIVASFDSVGYDPILCAQDKPGCFTVEMMDISENSAAAAVRTDFANHLIYVGLIEIDGQWKIADITCPGIESSASEMPTAVASAMPPLEVPTPVAWDDAGVAVPDGWLVYQNQEYGFQVAYPPDWAAVEIPVQRPDGSVPDAEASLVGLVQLLPQAWAEKMGGPPDPTVTIYGPVSIDITVGSEEDHRRRYPEPGATETLEINGLVVTVERDTYDDFNVIRYVFQHSENADLRVVVQDFVNGFSTRVAENPEIVEIVPLVISSFEFTR
jgi:hypothetical protein